MGIGLGTWLGAALGYLLDDMATALPLGMVLGTAIGLLLDNLSRRRQADEEQPAVDGG